MSMIGNLLRSTAAPSVKNAQGESAEAAGLRRLYLDMVQRTIINTVYEDPAQTFGTTYQPEVREIGSDWPSLARTISAICPPTEARAAALSAAVASVANWTRKLEGGDVVCCTGAAPPLSGVPSEW